MKNRVEICGRIEDAPVFDSIGNGRYWVRFWLALPDSWESYDNHIEIRGMVESKELFFEKGDSVGISGTLASGREVVCIACETIEHRCIYVKFDRIERMEDKT